MSDFSKRYGLWVIFSFGLLVRLGFWLWGAEIFLGPDFYIFGDSSGWSDSFLNLLNTGYYTFNPSSPHAAFGRVPGYSFFWGANYLIFGKTYVYQGVALTQIALDCITIILLYKISWQIFKSHPIALFTALLYAYYPFTIIWVTVSYPEILANFLCCLWLYVLVIRKQAFHYILLGILSASIFFVREFVGLVLVVGLVCVLLESRENTLSVVFTRCLLVGVSFLVVYAPWPIRNYYNHGELILGRSYKGFSKYSDDYNAYRNWVLCWDHNEDRWLREICSEEENVHYPETIFSSEEEKKYAYQLTKQARVCGSSFLEWRKIYDKNMDKDRIVSFCDDTLAAGFKQLRAQYIRQHGVEFMSIVPFRNLTKILFKNSVMEGSMVKSNFSFYYSLLFAWRSLLILLGIMGGLFYWKHYPFLLPILFFTILTYTYFAWVVRYIEIRNFIYVDTLLLIPAAFLFYKAVSGLYLIIKR